jgi:hypothetical protein
MSLSDEVYEAVKTWIHKQVMAQPLEESEHGRFFQACLGQSPEESRKAAMVYLASCYALGLDPGLQTRSRPGVVASWEFDDEFRKAGLGNPNREPSGKTNVTLRTANHLQGKKNHREALTGMSPARRDAIRAEMAKLMSLPAKAWRYEKTMTAIGVRG